jgi:hypothetical protein
VKRGTKVTVTDNDTTAHTFTADNGDSFDTGNIDRNASTTVVLRLSESRVTGSPPRACTTASLGRGQDVVAAHRPPGRHLTAYAH